MLQPWYNREYLHLNSESSLLQRSTSGSKEWVSSSAVDMYGGSTTFSVKIGEKPHEKQLKEAPEWMVKSTVHSETIPDGETTPNMEMLSQRQTITDHQIMSNLLAHEGREDVTPSSPLAEEEAEYSSSSDENSTGIYMDNDSAKEDSSGEDEFTVRIGNQVIPVNQVTSDMVKSMTDEEKERYKQVYQLAVSQAEFY